MRFDVDEFTRIKSLSIFESRSDGPDDKSLI